MSLTAICAGQAEPVGAGHRNVLFLEALARALTKLPRFLHQNEDVAGRQPFAAAFDDFARIQPMRDGARDVFGQPHGGRGAHDRWRSSNRPAPAPRRRRATATPRHSPARRSGLQLCSMGSPAKVRPRRAASRAKTRSTAASTSSVERKDSVSFTCSKRPSAPRTFSEKAKPLAAKDSGAAPWKE